ncbi:DUF6400 family protein [Streptomyces sp. NBC_00190]|uniref:DUF6400 family protein n=1 Tax=unclassified Streptomyces TaxID=2593676 RepID=UPI002E28302A|nr:DUF6400 family protein [Streptomyces sp. NBC_00190]WSZ38590.1 DUF6400 family protein [Streptomyces sp. NBC_00868]
MPQPTPPSDPSNPADPRPPAPGLIDFTVDLTSQEVLRRAQVMAALGPDWDPIEVLQGEEAAYDLLYSGLDEQQQRLYDDLVAAHVLPRRGSGHAAP